MDPVKGDRLEIIASTLWRNMLSPQQLAASGTRCSELFVACALLFKQCCNPQRVKVELQFSHCNSHASTIFFQKLSHMVWCWLVPRDAFIDVALVHCCHRSIDDRVPKSSVSSAQRALHPWKSTPWSENSSKRLSVRNVDGALSSVMTSFVRVDVSAMPSRTAEPWCRISSFIKLKKETPKPLLTLAIVFCTSKLLDKNKKHQAQRRIQRDTNRYVVRILRFPLWRRPTHSDRLVSWQPATMRIRTDVYQQCKKLIL